MNRAKKKIGEIKERSHKRSTKQSDNNKNTHCAMLTMQIAITGANGNCKNTQKIHNECVHDST